MPPRTVTIQGTAPGVETVQALLNVVPHCTHVSLDVFDTIVVRSCGTPNQLFGIVWRQAVTTSSLQFEQLTFVQARCTAEQAMLQRFGRLDSKMRLENIYTELCYRLDLPLQWVEFLVTLELDCERCVLRSTALGEAIPQLAAMTNVILTSDMYLTELQMRYVLGAALGDLSDIEIFSSQRVAASKSSGRIFPIVLSEVGARPRQTVHAGDSLGADVRQPRRIGMRTIHLDNGRFNRYETNLCSFDMSTHELGGMLAGASRSVRLGSAPPSQNGPLLSVATGALAPLSISFTIWILRRAISNSCAQVVFLARDGLVPFKLAKILVAKLDLPLDIRYLNVSRRTTNLAGFYDLNTLNISWILRGAIGKQIGAILNRIGLAPSEIPSLVEHHIAADSVIDSDTLALLHSALEEDDTLGLILENAQNQRQLFLRQFQEDGVNLDARLAFVDGGGTGSQIGSIDNVMRGLGNSVSRYFLFGLDLHPDRNMRPAIAEADWLRRTKAWVYDDVRAHGFPKTRGLSTVMQLAFAPTHGSIVGYEQDIGSKQQIPVEDPQSLSELHNWGVSAIHDAAVAMAKSLDPDALRHSMDADMVPSVVANAREFYLNPTVEEASVWGEFPFESGDMEASRVRQLAPPYTARQLLGYLVRRELPTAYGHWHEGARRRTGLSLRITIHVAEWLFRIVRRRQGGDPFRRIQP